jgi:hypothetical protein
MRVNLEIEILPTPHLSVQIPREQRAQSLSLGKAEYLDAASLAMLSPKLRFAEVTFAIWIWLAWEQAAGVTPALRNHTFSIAILLHYANAHALRMVRTFVGTPQGPRTR